MTDFIKKLFSKDHLMILGFALSPNLLREYELSLKDEKSLTDKKAA
ncbi:MULTISPECIES: hypothetical protein [Clostridium]|nr:MULTISPECIES: hypothetical protein [Clostridium]